MSGDQKEEINRAIFQSGIILFLLSCIFLTLGAIGMLLSSDSTGLYADSYMLYIGKHAFSLLIVGIVICGASVYMIYSKWPKVE